MSAFKMHLLSMAGARCCYADSSHHGEGEGEDDDDNAVERTGSPGFHIPAELQPRHESLCPFNAASPRGQGTLSVRCGSPWYDLGERGSFGSLQGTTTICSWQMSHVPAVNVADLPHAYKIRSSLQLACSLPDWHGPAASMSRQPESTRNPVLLSQIGEQVSDVGGQQMRTQHFNEISRRSQAQRLQFTFCDLSGLTLPLPGGSAADVYLECVRDPCARGEGLTTVSLDWPKSLKRCRFAAEDLVCRKRHRSYSAVQERGMPQNVQLLNSLVMHTAGRPAFIGDRLSEGGCSVIGSRSAGTSQEEPQYVIFADAPEQLKFLMDASCNPLCAQGTGHGSRSDSAPTQWLTSHARAACRPHLLKYSFIPSRLDSCTRDRQLSMLQAIFAGRVLTSDAPMHLSDSDLAHLVATPSLQRSPLAASMDSAIGVSLEICPSSWGARGQEMLQVTTDWARCHAVCSNMVIVSERPGCILRHIEDSSMPAAGIEDTVSSEAAPATGLLSWSCKRGAKGLALEEPTSVDFDKASADCDKPLAALRPWPVAREEEQFSEGEVAVDAVTNCIADAGEAMSATALPAAPTAGSIERRRMSSRKGATRSSKGSRKQHGHPCYSEGSCRKVGATRASCPVKTKSKEQSLQLHSAAVETAIKRQRCTAKEQSLQLHSAALDLVRLDFASSLPAAPPDSPILSKSSALERPTRRRMRPLEHWRNEQVVYERKPGSLLPTVSAVFVQPAPAAPQNSVQLNSMRALPNTVRKLQRDEAAQSSAVVVPDKGASAYHRQGCSGKVTRRTKRRNSALSAAGAKKVAFEPAIEVDHQSTKMSKDFVTACRQGDSRKDGIMVHRVAVSKTKAGRLDPGMPRPRQGISRKPSVPFQRTSRCAAPVQECPDMFKGKKPTKDRSNKRTGMKVLRDATVSGHGALPEQPESQGIASTLRQNDPRAVKSRGGAARESFTTTWMPAAHETQVSGMAARLPKSGRGRPCPRSRGLANSQADALGLKPGLQSVSPPNADSPAAFTWPSFQDAVDATLVSRGGVSSELPHATPRSRGQQPPSGTMQLVRGAAATHPSKHPRVPRAAANAEMPQSQPITPHRRRKQMRVEEETPPEPQSQCLQSRPTPQLRSRQGGAVGVMMPADQKGSAQSFSDLSAAPSSSRSRSKRQREGEARKQQPRSMTLLVQPTSLMAAMEAARKSLQLGAGIAQTLAH